jgi:hypothetical protein
MSAVVVHCKLCTVYWQHVMSEQTIRLLFKMKTKVVGWQSVVTDDTFQSDRRNFIISEFLYVFPQFSHTDLCKIITG